MNSRKARGRTCLMQSLGGADQGLRGHAANVDASAADRPVADKRYLCAELGGRNHCRETGGAGADDDEVGSPVAPPHAVAATRTILTGHVLAPLSSVSVTQVASGYLRHR